MTIKQALTQAVIMLKNENIEAPKNKARMLLEHTLKKTKEYLIIYDTQEISQIEREQYIKNVKRLINGEPLQYITGHQEFMKLNFFVTKDVLIPRQDTEILVEETINIAKNYEEPKILDLCTGSGAIAVSLAKNLDNSNIVATDISQKVIDVAIKNASFNGVRDKIEFFVSNLFNKIKDQKFDIIVSNPPYIETATIKKLSKEVQNEPISALDGGSDGLDFYRKIAEKAPDYLNENGYLCLEIGYNQKLSVKKILEQNKYENIYCKKDLCENDRVIVAKVAKGS